MEENKVLLTQSGIEKLRKERETLINVERPKVIEELQAASSRGLIRKMLTTMQQEINKLL